MTRNTIQCSMVLDTVKKLDCHADADEIYSRIRKDYPNISKGTVYRNLKRLSDEGQLLRIEIPGGADRYDHRVHKHYHIKCDKCSRVFDVDMTEVPELEKLIRDTHGFEFTGCDIIFRGICPDCRSSGEKDNG